jgi:hypothetical protein
MKKAADPAKGERHGVSCGSLKENGAYCILVGGAALGGEKAAWAMQYAPLV